MKVASAIQMSRVDEKLINEHNYSITSLVEMASCALLEEIPNVQSYLLLVGPGNNGADALSLAKRLVDRHNKVYIKLFYFDKANDTVMHFYEQIKDEVEFVDEIAKTDIVIDGIFGNGLMRSLDDKLQDFLTKINQMRTIRIAIDIPTGINATSGLLQPTCFKAHKTVTFMCQKIAMLNSEFQEDFGKIVVKPFGIEKEVLEEVGISEIIDQDTILSFLKVRTYHAHKGVMGKITHFTGSKSYTGAACLASLASVHTGSGIVRVCSEKEVLKQVNFHNLEAITLNSKELNGKDLNGYNAFLCGCGCGWNEKTEELVHFLLQNSNVPLVIDADAINVLSEHVEWLDEKRCPVILTPHLGEFARLCPEYNNLEDAICHFADRYDVTMVVKGPNTIVYSDHHMYRNTTGNQGMATAGMGDVLAGIISSLCGQGYSALQASQFGVYLHGLCGDELYKNQETVLPHRLIEKIPTVMKELSCEKNSYRINKSF